MAVITLINFDMIEDLFHTTTLVAAADPPRVWNVVFFLGVGKRDSPQNRLILGWSVFVFPKISFLQKVFHCFTISEILEGINDLNASWAMKKP